MPRLLTRDEAVVRIRAERGDTTCLVCALRDGSIGERNVIFQSREATVLLSRYPTRWGHLLVLCHRHVTSFSELAESEWQLMNALALRGARALERALNPTRCYVGAFGTAKSQIEISSPHLHLHVVPTYGEDERPSLVFTWQNGVYTGTNEEWTELESKIRRAWDEVG
jgi:diadenosine tetraphosphate (Ap4A) HIT family hydrolase